MVEAEQRRGIHYGLRGPQPPLPGRCGRQPGQEQLPAGRARPVHQPHVRQRSEPRGLPGAGPGRRRFESVRAGRPVQGRLRAHIFLYGDVLPGSEMEPVVHVHAQPEPLPHAQRVERATTAEMAPRRPRQPEGARPQRGGVQLPGQPQPLHRLPRPGGIHLGRQGGSALPGRLHGRRPRGRCRA